jgi:hypothetical protein
MDNSKNIVDGTNCKERDTQKPANQSPNVFTRLSPARPTKVYDTYWRLAAERQNIFFKRVAGAPSPWTDDQILQTYKFTNAYRASDRVSQYLIRDVIYAANHTPIDTFFRILLFKTFNRIETWQALETRLGSITYSEFDLQQYDRLLSEILTKGRSIYSGAYMMPSGRTSYGQPRKHSNHLLMILAMMKSRLPHRIVEAKSMRHVFDLLLGFPTIGYFLAYQYAIDVNYSTLTSFAEMDFVVPGPGAKDGIRKCFDSLGGLSEIDIIKLMTDRQEIEFQRLGLHFKSLCGRRLQLIDCQNLFCETDKYARVAHPDIRGVSRRTRIKQKYAVGKAMVAPWYPPKWGINHLTGRTKA